MNQIKIKGNIWEVKNFVGTFGSETVVMFNIYDKFGNTFNETRRGRSNSTGLFRTQIDNVKVVIDLRLGDIKQDKCTK